MEIGIIGLPQSGKSALFQIMTGANSRDAFGEQFVKATAKVPDSRFDRLVEIYKPKKSSPAYVPFIDINAQGKEAWSAVRQGLSTADGFLHIIDAHTNAGIDNIIKNYRQLADELIFSDLVVVESRLERLAKASQKTMRPDEAAQIKLLPAVKECLENGKPLRELKLRTEELNVLKGFTFWTLRPELVVLNIGEGNPDVSGEFTQKCGTSSPVVSICCQIEMEIAQLPPGERGEFLAFLGIETPAFERIIRSAFSLIGRICYFTVGEDEVKAWVIPAGSTAPRAASAIHKDFERGFIKAEVVGYDDFIASGAKPKYRLEGKEYIVKDGDVINFKFNV